MEQIMRRLNCILEDTTKLCFPIFANKYKKQEIIKKKKEEIDDDIELILSQNHLYLNQFMNHRKELWKNAETDAHEFFQTLPDDIQINSFYFQEVMHRYVEYIKQFILNV